MKSLTRIIAILTLAWAGSASAALMNITFDSLELPGNSFTLLPNPSDIEGFRFQAIAGTGGGIPVSFQQSSALYNGSAALTGSNSSDILMTEILGGLFSVTSVDVDGLFSPTNPIFEFIGQLSGGGQITQTFSPDTILGNQTVNLVGFQNLTSLTFGGVGANGLSNIGSIDNINNGIPTPTPSPSTIALFALGLLAMRRRVTS